MTKRRFAIAPPPPVAVLWALFAILILAIVISLMFGRYAVPPRELLDILLGRNSSGDGFGKDTAHAVLFNIRLPRILLACMVGACLSTAGASYQGVFQNPMASPDILGAAQGAAFGAALGILIGGNSGLITFLAFSLSLVSVALVFAISKRARGKQVLTLILSGIMVSSLFAAGTSFVKLVADPSNQLPSITYWLMGSLAGAKTSDLGFLAVMMLVGITPLMLLRWRLNLLTLSDDEARSMGVNTRLTRIIVITCASFITAAAVSVSGLIGWVGLVIPHLCRMLVGNDFKHLLPTSLLFGALFMLIVDNVSRNLLPSEIPIGILTAFVGAPFFLWLITRRGEPQ